jgi:cytochrome c oxidase subunit 2
MKRFLAILLALGAPAALAAPLEETGFGMPHDASTHGHLIDALIHETSFFVVLMFVIAVGWMVYSVLVHGEKHKAVFDHGDTFKSYRWTLFTAAAIFFVVDGKLYVSSMSDLAEVFGNFAMVEADPKAVRIEINAHQWMWTARYAGPDGKFNTADDIVTNNDVVIPQGSPVIFQVASTDVIHNFNLPNLRAKIDAVPGTINRMWVEARETGEFDIACAQHCGANHYKMKGKLTVLPRADYERWAAQASVNSARAFDDADADAHWGWDWAAHAARN